MAHSNPLTPSTTNQADVNEIPLTLSGSTTRKLFFFDIYKISHYMALPREYPKQKNAAISFIRNVKSPQRIELVFLRDVSRSQIEDALIDGIERNNTDGNLASINEEIARLSEGVDVDVNKNAMLSLSRPAKDQLKVSFNNNVIVETRNEALADALWSIWFGNDPIVDTEELVKNLIDK